MSKATSLQKLVVGFLSLVLLISLGFSLYRGYARYLVDSNYKTVQMLVNYDDIRMISNLSSKSIYDVAMDFKKAGATGVVVKERTLTVGILGAQNALVLSQDASIMTGIDLRRDAALKNQLELASGVNPRNNYIWIENDQLRETVLGHIQAKTDYGKLTTYQGMNLIDSGPVDGNLLTMGVGYPTDNLKEIAKAGLTISPQVKDWANASDESAEFVVNDILSLPNLNGVYFNDSKIPMFEHPEMSKLAREQTIGFIEFFSADQKGIETLIRQTYNGSSFNVQRMHSIGASQMIKETKERNLAQFKLAVAEREIRATFVSFPFTGNINQDNETALDFIRTLKSVIEKDGYLVGSSHLIFNMPSSSRIFTWVVGLAAVVGTAMLGWILGQMRIGAILALIGLMGWTLALFILPSVAKQLMAIYACTLFPVIAITWMLRLQPRGLFKVVQAFLVMSLVSLMGAAVQVGLLTENAYVMGIDIFRGVKIVLVAPMLLVLLAVLMRWERFDIHKVKAFFSKPVNVLSLAGLAILGAVVFVYVRRSGNTGTVSTLEIVFRQALDQILGVRPRTKEFLVGHPAMIVVLYFGYKKRWLPLIILGAIGQTSMVNTFSHFHTPIIISLIRTFHGVWIGLAIGVFAIWAIELFLKLLPKGWKATFSNDKKELSNV